MRARPADAVEASILTLAAVAVASVLWAVVAALSGLSPLATLVAVGEGAFGSWFAVGQTLRAATPLLLVGLAVALPMRAGLLVIGSEGAFVLGGLAAAVAAAAAPPALSLLALLAAGAFVGGAWLAVAGMLRARLNLHEAITTILMTYVAIALSNHLVEGALRDPASLDKPATRLIGQAAQIAPIGSGPLHWGLPAGLLVCVVAHVVVAHTPLGFSMRVHGGNPLAAAYAGIRPARIVVGACVACGLLAGLAGAIEVGAVQHQASASLAQGYGYVGILVAVLARGNMLLVPLAAVFVGALEAGGGMLQRQLGAPAASAQMMQGLLFVALVMAAAWRGRLATSWATRGPRGA